MPTKGVAGAGGTLKGLSIEGTGYALLASQLEMQDTPQNKE